MPSSSDRVSPQENVWAFRIFAAGVALLVLYVASVGPISWLCAIGWVAEDDLVMTSFYRPCSSWHVFIRCCSTRLWIMSGGGCRIVGHGATR